MDPRAVEHPGTEGEVTTRISWPLFSTLDGPRIHSRSYAFLLILPLYTHTLDLKTGSEIDGFPWPFWTIERDAQSGERRSIRLMPIYERRTTATMEQVFYFWPFYRRHTGLGDSSGYRRSDVLFLFYRDQIEGETPSRGHIRALVPLWVSREENGAGEGQSLAFLDGLFPKNENLKTLYAPLYRIYGEESRDGRTRRDFLWEMVRMDDGKLRPPWYFSRD